MLNSYFKHRKERQEGGSSWDASGGRSQFAAGLGSGL